VLLIIGGGIGGMTAALAVAQAGLDVHLVEQAPEFGEIGAGIQLAPNAMRILDRLGLLPALDEVCVRPRNVIFMHADTGERLGTVDLGPAFRRHYGQSYTVVHRGDLLEILLGACRAHPRITLETGRSAIDVREDGEVTFADGTSLRAAGVIGADGLWSRTRALLCDDQPICSRYGASRATLPVGDAEVDDEYIWIGPGKHLVQYPIRQGNLYNQVAVFHSRRYQPGSHDWGMPDELAEAFATSCGTVRAAIERMPTDRRWPMYDRTPIGNWTKGRVTLLGDAAHPMLQYLAQGACQAIEDADCLARHLSTQDTTIEEAFVGYQAERVERTAQVQTVARAWGEIWHADGLIVPALRDRVFARRSPDDYTDLDWLYQEAR
jgi:2-polyprenyl-6-methoxyphenol hydroxylase-like FAD-dependent oxidoreductase